MPKPVLASPTRSALLPRSPFPAPFNPALRGLGRGAGQIILKTALLKPKLEWRSYRLHEIFTAAPTENSSSDISYVGLL